MAKIKIEFDGKIYSVNENTLASLASPLERALIQQLAGTGAVIRFGGSNYNVDAAKLASARNVLTNHIGNVAGTDSKVIVNDTEYGLSKTKLQGATDRMNKILSGMKGFSEGLAYVLNDDGQSYNVSGIGVCTDTELNIPSEYQGLPVVGINARAFDGCSRLTNVTLPDTIVTLGTYSFAYCSNIVSFTIPANITNVEMGVFLGCCKLVEIVNKSALNISETVFYETYEPGLYGGTVYALEIHSGDSKIVNKDDLLFYTFEGVNYLVGYAGTGRNIILPTDYNGETYVINNYAFFDSRNLTSITIPNSIPSIGDMAFYGCRKLVEVINHSNFDITLGSYMNGYIGENALEIHSGDSKLIKRGEFLVYNLNGTEYLIDYDGNSKDVVLPESFTGVLYKYAFYNNDSIVSLIIPDSACIDISNSEFTSLINLIDVNLSGGVGSIGVRAFNNCKALKNVVFGSGINAIGDSAFSGCESLTSVDFGNGLTTIGKFAFNRCLNLVDIIIPDSVEIINNEAFRDCKKITALTIGKGVKSIGDYAFSGCSAKNWFYNSTIDNWCSVTQGSQTNDYTHDLYVRNNIGDYEQVIDLVIPETVTAIAPHAFGSCKNIRSLTIPDSVTSIGAYAFYDCTSIAMTTLTIPDSVTSVGGYAFYAVPASKLVTPACGVSAFSTNALVDVTVTTGNIGDELFRGRSKLTSVTLCNNVTGIGIRAFENCYSLTSVTIGNGVTSIGGSAFAGCKNLKSIHLPESIVSIGNIVFTGCNNLTSITVADTNPKYKSIDGNLYSKDGKTLVLYAIGKPDITFTIPDGVEIIGNYAAYASPSLWYVIIPSSVVAIRDYAFYKSPKLREIHINNPSSAVKLGYDWRPSTAGIYWNSTGS